MSDSRRYGALFRAGMSDTHRRTVEWVPRGARVLELGCACGDLGALLQREKNCDVLGVEVDPAAAAEAKGAGLEVIVGSLEDPATLEGLRVRGPFDVIVATDVLEHLRDPEPVVTALPPLLAPGGHLIVAVPNIASWSMRWDLLRHGRWEYAESGVLDRTHLRFFTWDSIHALVEERGWRVVDRMVDGYDLPGGNFLLGTVLDGMRASVTGWTDDPPGLRRDLRYRANLFFDGLIRMRQRLHRRLVARVPNLVAPHVALLLARGTA